MRLFLGLFVSLWSLNVLAAPSPIIWGPGSTAQNLATGGFTSPSGTSSAPSLSFTSDSTTGFYLIGAGDLGATAGGSLALDLKNVSGNVNVGIGAAAGGAGSALIAQTSQNAVATYSFANVSNGTAGGTSFLIGDGSSSNYTLIENFATSATSNAQTGSGYLNGGSDLLANANQTQLVVGAMYSAAFIGFPVGGNDFAHERMRIDSNGHILYHDATVPTVASGCGSTPPVVKGNDSAGILGTGTGASITSCVMNFIHTWSANAPLCFVSDSAGALAVQVATSTSQLTLTTLTTMGAGTSFYYHCIGYD